MPTSEVLTLERSGAVATVWLDSPDRRNAMGPAFWADLPVFMEAVSDDDEIRAVVIAAKGPHFTVGLDLKTMGGTISSGGAPSTASRAHRFYRDVKKLQHSITSVANCPKPVIAAVHGYCLGGGVDLITATDIRLCSADAVFSVRETRMAMVADVGTLQRLPRIIGAGHVAELALTGKDISADRARQIGLVNDVHADRDALLKAANALALEIAANSPLAVQGAKQVLRASADRTVAEGLDYVAAWNAGFIVSNDLTEAMTAFLEKRPPVFRGD